MSLYHACLYSCSPLLLPPSPPAPLPLSSFSFFSLCHHWNWPECTTTWPKTSRQKRKSNSSVEINFAIAYQGSRSSLSPSLSPPPLWHNQCSSQIKLYYRFFIYSSENCQPARLCHIWGCISRGDVGAEGVGHRINLPFGHQSCVCLHHAHVHRLKSQQWDDSDAHSAHQHAHTPLHTPVHTPCHTHTHREGTNTGKNSTHSTARTVTMDERSRKPLTKTQLKRDRREGE